MRTKASSAKDPIERAVEDFITDTDNLHLFVTGKYSSSDGGAGPLKVTSTSFLGGSSWSSAYKISTSHPELSLFVKTARGRNSDSMFKGEAMGLTAMYESTPALSIPKVFTYGDAGNGSYIIMEYLNFTSGSDMKALGAAVGAMHMNGTSDAFGFDVDNTIGGTPQPNTWCENWPEFFKQNRLLHQVRLANDSRLASLCDQLVKGGHYDRLFDGLDAITPSLLHGDLWSGNIGWSSGKPSLFDPACYYGHSEAEFGMSWCAGLSRGFWDAYFEVVPKQQGFDQRHDLYTLYHYLNHYNLFGSGYYGQCERLFTKLIR
jgi:protein-ribulosamine 3-kinase